MQTRVDVAAVRDARGRTVLSRVHGEGQLAVRETPSSAGPAVAQVHLVATAAGPLAGDDVLVAVRVAAGASLQVRSSGATLALPAWGGGRVGSRHARLRVEAVVAADATLDVACQPTVVCLGADLATRLDVDAAPSARVTVVEDTVLGRHGERGGRWSSRTVVDVAGAPRLRSSLDSRALAPQGSAAVVTRLVLDGGAEPPPRDLAGPVASRTDGARLVATPLAGGGHLVTAWGESRPAVVSAVAAAAAVRTPGG